MVERVGVGKAHPGAHLHRQDIGGELALLLVYQRRSRLGLRRAWLDPEHRVTERFALVVEEHDLQTFGLRQCTQQGQQQRQGRFEHDRLPKTARQ